MTESSLLTTHSIPNHYPVTAAPSLASPLPDGSLSDTNARDEEEYTIKCICSYTDDDGSTVYCPKCDTWQHILCFYNDRKVPDEHFCADCLPRDLDAKKATDRQRRHREGLDDGSDRKAKRPNSKTQKKKHKENSTTTEQVNGWHSHDRHESVASARDLPPAKKPKTNHRTSGSIVSMNGDSRKRAASTVQSYPSPSKSPQDLFRFPAIPTYTTEFLELYDRDEGNTDARDNEQTIKAANQLSAWRSDPSLIVSGPGQQPTQSSPFVRLNRPLDPVTFPKVSIETVQKTDVEVEGRHPKWRYLRIQTPVKKDEIVGEVRGQIGMLEEYCSQRSTSNRWNELRHPDPFVFFHPHMHVYIDSRKSGTEFRYLRRSCRPNVTLKTFISDDDETHHCFVASTDIPAGSELTTIWFLGDEMNFDGPHNDSEQAQSRRLDWVSRVLANFGDCACEGSDPCHLARLDRRFSARALEAPTKEKAGKKKKSKNKNAISPFSTGHATNSRAGSEPKVQDDDDHFDRRSTSESSRSGGPSRDITPVNVAALDADPVLGSGLTARELRKIQMAEKAFAQREQEKKDHNGQNQQRKKKRTSGGSTLNTPNINTSKQIGHSSSSHPPTPSASRLNGTTSASPPPQKGYPVSGDMLGRSEMRTTIPNPRPVYVSIAIQTDPEESELPMPPMKRRKFCTPTQRLLRRLLEDRAKHGQHLQEQPSPSSKAPSHSHPEPVDVEMGDAPSETSPATVLSPALNVQPKSPESPVNVGTSYPLPSQAAHTHIPYKISSRPQLSTLPPVPAFSSNGTGFNSMANAIMPGLTPITTVQTPVPMPPAVGTLAPGVNSIVTPSPARKKLSLGDYMSRRNLASTPTSEKAHSHGGLNGIDTEMTKDGEQYRSSPSAPDSSPANLRPSEELVQQAAAQGGLSGSAVDDTSMKDESDEPEYSPPGASPLALSIPEANKEEPPISANGRVGIGSAVSNMQVHLAQVSGK
jgi:hypothetical protein